MSNEAIIAAPVISINALIARILVSYILPLFGVLAFAAIIYAGVLIVTSSGEPEKLKKAKSTILWTIVGIFIVVLSYALITAYGNIVNNIKP